MEEEIKEVQPEENLILTLAIVGHGCEDYLNPFPRASAIGEYYRNNVRAYSASAVPDITCVMGAVEAGSIVDKIYETFKENPHAETKEIVNSIKDDMRIPYQKRVLRSEQLKLFANDPKFKRNTEPRYLSQASNLVAYLANKEFWFYDEHENEVISTSIEKKIHENIGIHVIDIRRRITNADGNITYKKVSIPSSFKVAELNLAYKIGVETFCELLFNKNLGTDASLESMYDILGFKEESQDKLKMISLVELYEFFKVQGFDYVNIFDMTCRSCKTRTLDENEIADIGNSEYVVSRKTKAFGLRKKYRKSKKRSKRRFKRRSKRRF